ncbi:unnamed protein product [Mesocestoides corti]|uniref:Uncharacterized protein n=1 Tax=Mesocestoides corti TaxID=53468 RepID=A0A0R3UKT4_MESCO|nr:unnamed protein product [Mesocestoides corti]
MPTRAHVYRPALPQPRPLTVSPSNTFVCVCAEPGTFKHAVLAGQIDALCHATLSRASHLGRAYWTVDVDAALEIHLAPGTNPDCLKRRSLRNTNLPTLQQAYQESEKEIHTGDKPTCRLNLLRLS